MTLLDMALSVEALCTVYNLHSNGLHGLGYSVWWVRYNTAVR